jgi:hypothetical protein
VPRAGSDGGASADRPPQAGLGFAMSRFPIPMQVGPTVKCTATVSTVREDPIVQLGGDSKLLATRNRAVNLGRSPLYAARRSGPPTRGRASSMDNPVGDATNLGEPTILATGRLALKAIRSPGPA